MKEVRAFYYAPARLAQHCSGGTTRKDLPTSDLPLSDTRDCLRREGREEKEARVNWTFPQAADNRFLAADWDNLGSSSLYSVLARCRPLWRPNPEVGRSALSA